jgi:hypothetical protein
MALIADAIVVIGVVAFVTMFVTIAFRTAFVADAISMISRVLCTATWTRLIDLALLATLVAKSSAVVLLATFLTKFIGTALFNALRLIFALVTN